MTIKMTFVDELFCPLFVCDICGERISSAREAAAVFHMLAPMPHIDVQHVHKGKCLDIAERNIGYGFGWQELSEHIKHLENNATPKTK